MTDNNETAAPGSSEEAVQGWVWALASVGVMIAMYFAISIFTNAEADRWAVCADALPDNATYTQIADCN